MDTNRWYLFDPCRKSYQTESGGTIFDRGAEAGAPGANAFDGVNVINGAELMTENGSLRFVVGLNALASGYDANGNMTLRLKDGARYFLAYDAESRLTSVSGTVSASFVYNGDGQRVTATVGTTITTYIGGYFEWQGGVGKSYYFAGGQRIAMRTGTDLKFLLGDHLGSTSVTAYASGAIDTETRYYPWGGVRWASGTTPTDYRFTGQQEVASIGLYFYNSRFYDASLGRFVSPDSIIPNPGDPVSFDRFAYVRNNPLKYIDPSGHNPKCGPDGVWCNNDNTDELIYLPMTGVEPSLDGLDSDGQQAYDQWLDWNSEPGWWNNNTIGGLSVEQYLGILLLFELAEEYQYGALDLLIEAFARQIWSEIDPDVDTRYCIAGSECFAGLFNFIGHELQAASNRYGELPGNQPPGFESLSQAGGIGYQILNPLANWTIKDPNAPYYYGNNQASWNPDIADKYNSLDDREILGPDALVLYKNGDWYDTEDTALQTFAIWSSIQDVLLTP